MFRLILGFTALQMRHDYDRKGVVTCFQLRPAILIIGELRRRKLKMNLAAPQLIAKSAGPPRVIVIGQDGKAGNQQIVPIKQAMVIGVN